MQMIANVLGYDEFMPQSNFLRLLSKYACDLNIIEKKICSNILFLTCGFDHEQFNYVSNSVRAHRDTVFALHGNVLIVYHRTTACVVSRHVRAS